MKHLPWALIVLGVALAGCGPKTTSSDAADRGGAPTAVALYADRCSVCHGAAGAGDGPAGRALTPKPRGFSDPTWQARVTDGHLRKVIVHGGAGAGLSPLMPANPDLAAHPSTVNGLIKLIRGFNAAR